MSYSPNSSRGGYIEEYFRGYKGGTRSLDYSSYWNCVYTSSGLGKGM